MPRPCASPFWQAPDQVIDSFGCGTAFHTRQPMRESAIQRGCAVCAGAAAETSSNIADVSARAGMATSISGTAITDNGEAPPTAGYIAAADLPIAISERFRGNRPSRRAEPRERHRLRQPLDPGLLGGALAAGEERDDRRIGGQGLRQDDVPAEALPPQPGRRGG